SSRMPTQGRSKPTIRGAKAPVRGNKGKGARRAPVKSATDVPILAIVVAAVLLALFVGIFIYGAINNRPVTQPVVHGSSGDIPCDRLERTQVHYHAALQIMYNGTLHQIPGGIGITGGETAPTCFYWLHVHSANTDVIHIESPAQDSFTLGDFFKVWDAWSTAAGGPHEVLSSTQVSTLTLATGQQMFIYVDLQDGKGPTLYQGDPNNIPLKAHEVITIEMSGASSPPPPFTFTQGL
ncbi:MAG TPA: hypothetical protein VFO75_00905, partial [Candidatus Dormibacteraeota bacterium]|nr:hypothetical protein [Candidatus Dormibacteraeota bacterium]